MKQMHDIQLQILKKLLFNPTARYVDMKPDDEMENNKFDFHLDRLIKAGYVEKNDKAYSLTAMGKGFANEIDSEKLEITKQSKVTVWVSCIRIVGGKKQFLIGTRLKQPFFGCQGFMTAKVRYGEKIMGAAKREMLEETNLTGEPQLVGIKHFRVFDKKTNDLLEDKFMYLLRVTDPEGELRGSEEGEFDWVDEDNMRTFITKPYEDIDEFMKYVDQVDNFSGQISFEEIDHWSEKF